jgi:NADH:ubiquinone oxidoreductase subunit F (NADH-binding)
MAFLLPAEPVVDVASYFRAGGGAGLEAAMALGPEGTIDEIDASGLRGRGGAGFPTGRKWRSVRGGDGEHYVVANGAEGEPATFKDRLLMRRDPYRVIEGAAIAALAVGAQAVYLATKASYQREAIALRRAAVELSGTGLLGDLSVSIVEGPDEYLFGEEKALLEVIEGRDPLPRALPPYEHGLFATVPIGWEDGDGATADWESNATAVNNVETLATVAHILGRGATWYRTMGTAASPGTLLATVVGDVVRPQVTEVEMGTPFDELLAMCGGPRDGRRFVAAFSGVSNRVLPAADFDVPLTYEDFANRGTGLGAAGFAVYDDSADMLSVAREFSRFLAIESCGQCPPCKSGSMEITDRLLTIEIGSGSERDVDVIAARLRTVTDANRCFLGTEELNVVSSVLDAFPDALVARLNGTAGPLRPAFIPLVKDIDDNGVVTYDERHAFKQPDWTYVDPAARR